MMQVRRRISFPERAKAEGCLFSKKARGGEKGEGG